MKQLFTIIVFFIYGITQSSFGQRTCPRVDEYYRGRHKIDGMMYGHPYTTFDRKNETSFEKLVLNIRTRIQSEYHPNPNNIGPVYKAYFDLYNHAKAANPNGQGDGLVVRDTNFYITGISSVPAWGKNNAFVFLNFTPTFN